MLGLADAGDQCFPYNEAFISGRSWDVPAGWPQAAVGKTRHGWGISMAQALRPVGSEGRRQLLRQAAQSLQRPCLVSHPPWKGCSSHQCFGRVSIPTLPWLNGPRQPSFPPAAAAPMLAPSSHPLWLSNLAHGHPLLGGLTLPIISYRNM